ncbi:MAG: hypothetical protein QE485_15295 [Acidovorax sp.]|uniref:hypothetical protein n=1 Tax=Acidovorax sp. TaxID=1872122 RepID=UPI002630AF26|nr:hypothetical protein [Acidovorax sp.]MDH4418576.1 hypothetical protein [Acidovorax sp.]
MASTILASSPPLRQGPAPFFVLWALLTGAYAVWLMAFWPGVLGEDSVAILQEVQNPDAFRSGKTVVWYYFVKWLYGWTGRVEVPVGSALVLCAGMLARILAWCWTQRLHKTLLFGLLAIALAPHMVYFMGTLYPDGLFAVASAALLFEVWLCVQRRAASSASLLMVAVALPFAAFLRPNGLVFLAPVVIACWWLDARSRLWTLIIVSVWSAAVFAGSQVHKSTTQETQFPLAAFETAGFLQKRAMNELWALYPHMNDPWVLQKPKVSPASVEALSRKHPIEKIQQYRDPAYWDMLVFHPDGPQLGALSDMDKQTVVREFWTYNLWQNLPDFIASRVNVFVSAALAQGGFPASSYATNVLPRVSSQSSYRLWHLDQLEHFLKKVHAKSYAWRWLLWTPWLGFMLLAWASIRGMRRADAGLLLISIPMIIQWGGVFLFSIAGEYRYLLPFFTLPLVMLPAIAKGYPPTHLDTRTQANAPRAAQGALLVTAP